MLLAELRPEWRRLQGLGECLCFDCPKSRTHRVCVPTNRWQIANREDFNKITITPSIDEGDCWHGHVTNGEIV